MIFENFIQSLHNQKPVYQPELFDLSKEAHFKEVVKLIEQNKIQQVRDDYDQQLRELFQVLYPEKVHTSDFENLFKKYFQEINTTPLHTQGTWVYFPWNGTIVHILKEEDFFQVRTARNRNLITKEEQEKFYNFFVGVAGLSVGNSVVTALVLQGGARKIKIADHDNLELSNTNRVRAGVTNLSLKKVIVTARQIYEINPYAEVHIYPEGLTEETIEGFFEGLDVVVDEIDNLAVKYQIRVEAQKMGLPVLMAADNGDNAVVDIERYDLDKDLNFFHGRMGNVTYEELKNLDKFGIGKMITKLVGPENVTERMQASLLEIGKTIVSWPQLGGAALINGSAVAYCVRKISNKQPLETNRALVSLDEKLEPDYSSDSSIEKRKQATKSFRNIFQL